MEKISDIFGSMVFNDAVMRERLPKETYRQVQATMEKRAEVMKYSLIVVASLPMMILYPFIQKYFVRGVMIGAVKG